MQKGPARTSRSKYHYLTENQFEVGVHTIHYNWYYYKLKCVQIFDVTFFAMVKLVKTLAHILVYNNTIIMYCIFLLRFSLNVFLLYLKDHYLKGEKNHFIFLTVNCVLQQEKNAF